MNYITEHTLPAPILEYIGMLRHIAYPAQGATSDVAMIESTAGRFVIKRTTRQPFRDWLRREHAVLQALASTTLPVPRAHAFMEQDAETWLLMEQLPGQTLEVALGAVASARERHALLSGFGRLLRAVHDCPPPPTLTGCGQPWLDSMLERAAMYLRQHPVDGTPELLEQLQRQRPNAVPPVVIHGDYTLHNVLVADGAVSGLIDWAGGALGDPRYDLALATEPKPEAFRSAADLDAFYAGYGGPRLNDKEACYFVGLYEFF